MFWFQTGSIKSWLSNSSKRSGNVFWFQTGSIKSESESKQIECLVNRFDSRLVRLKDYFTERPSNLDMFWFQTGSIKSKTGMGKNTLRNSFDSRLVRLKGSMKAVDILYGILMVRVKSNFTSILFKVDLLSTCNSVNLLGGWRLLTTRVFRRAFSRKQRVRHLPKTSIWGRSTADLGVIFLRKSCSE